MCCGCNKQIHTDYRSPVEKKGWHGHSLSERAPQPLPGQAFIAFLGTFTVVLTYYVDEDEDGPHLLCTGLL